MIRLFRINPTNSPKVALGFFLILTCLNTILHQLHVPIKVMPSLWILAFAAFLVTGMTYLGRNLTWLLNLPVKRLNLMIFVLVSNLMSLCLGLGAVVGAAALGFWFSKLMGTHSVLTAMESLSLSVVDEGESVYWHSLLIIYIVLSFFVGALLAYVPSPKPARESNTGLSEHRQRMLSQPKFFRNFLIASFAIFGFVSLFGFLWKNGFFLLAVFGPLVAVRLTWEYRNLYKPADKPHRLFRNTVATVAGAAVLLIYVDQIMDAHSSSPSRSVGAIQFLGPYSFRRSQESLEELLAQPLNKGEIQYVGGLYRKFYTGGQPLEPERDKLKFKNLLESKDNAWRVIELARQFNWRKLNFEHWQAVVEHLGNCLRCREAEFNYALLNRSTPFFELPLNGGEISMLLASENPTDNTFGLLKARFSRDKSLIPVIWDAAKRYDEELKLAAIHTLSVIEGKRISMKSLSRRRRKPASKTEEVAVDCSQFNPKSVRDINVMDEVQFNVCLHEKVAGRDLTLVHLTHGWIPLPNSSGELRDALTIVKRLNGSTPNP